MAFPSAQVTEPLVTVITPSLNQSRFIRATIESVLSQDYPWIEYLIVDGGSTDTTAAIAAEYDGRLTFVSEPDRGQSHAINKGFAAARGEVLAWLNSDDVFLPGAVSVAVRALQASRSAAAVYGDGCFIDEAGSITGTFPYSEPLNLWKLVHLSDYVLQQTLFVRKEALASVGGLDEKLQWVMDWDLLIRLAKRFPLEYVRQPMGCLRRYGATKTATGGHRRVREIRTVLCRHTGRRLAPGVVVYGLETYAEMARQHIRRLTPGLLSPAGRALCWLTTRAANWAIGRTVTRAQGVWRDGWAGPRLEWMLPAGTAAFALEGEIPSGTPGLTSQRLAVYHRRRWLGGGFVGNGEFRIVIPVPPDLRDAPLTIQVRARRCFVPHPWRPGGDRRRLSYLLRGVRAVPAIPAGGGER